MSDPRQRRLTDGEIERIVEEIADQFARDIGKPREFAAALLYAMIKTLQDQGISLAQATEYLSQEEPKKPSN
jgi:hypothetical protein